MLKMVNLRQVTDPKAVSVTDESGKAVITFNKVIALPTRSKYKITNGENEDIGTIEKIRYNFGLGLNLPEINIVINNQEIKIKKDIKELVGIYSIEGAGFSIVGDWFGANFEITKNEKVVASVDVEKEELGRNFSANINDESNKEEVMCILFALSWIL